VGIAQLEKAYEDELRGENGVETVLRDARGRLQRTFVEKAAKPGRHVVLTLDLDLQTTAMALLEGRPGVAMLMDLRDGGILAMASWPSFDPDHPFPTPKDIPTSYLNKAIQEHYLPGSTFKLVTATAAMQSGRSPFREVVCKGEFYLPGWDKPFRCEARYGHGPLELADAIKVSCNIYFYTLARDAGPEALVAMARAYGFGQRTGIDLIGEVPGLLPLRPDHLQPGSVLHLGIGQGPVAVTPLQLLAAYATFANGGESFTPHLLKRVESSTGEVIREYEPRSHDAVAMPSRSRQEIERGLRAVVDSPVGTASDARFPSSWQVAGKTGSAENPEGGTDAFFVGFAPASHPEVAFLVLLENAGHGGAEAAPVAKKLLNAYFQKRRRPVS
jgi:penicillin-binding protein 2